jgi:hypothetical protein
LLLVKVPGLPSRVRMNNLRSQRRLKDTDQRRQLTEEQFLQPLRLSPARLARFLPVIHRREQLRLLLLPMNLLPGTRRQRGLMVRQPGLMAQPSLRFPRSRVSPLLRP